MRPGDTVPFPFWRQTLQGSPASGKVLTDFSTSFNRNGVLASVSPSLAEGASVGNRWREYFLNVTLPASGPYRFSGLILPSRGLDAILGGAISLEVEANDLDSVAALATRTIGVVANTAGIGAVVPLNMAARRRNQVRVTLLDQTGAPVDLSDYTNPRFTVWDKTHSGGSSLYVLSSGITMSALGAIAFDVPETAAFYSASDTQIAAGYDVATLYYDLIADAAGVAANTDPILRGTILLDRWEGAATP